MRSPNHRGQGEKGLVSLHKTLSVTTPTCQIVHVLRQRNANPVSKVDTGKSLIQSGRLLYEKANSPINYFRRAPLFTYHTPNNAAHEGKITPYSSVLGIPEHRVSSATFRPGRKKRRLSPSSPQGSTKVPTGMLPVTCQGVNMEALEQRRKYNSARRVFNKHVHRARLESALQTMTYDPEFDAHEYLRDDITHELRIRSLEAMKHKYCNQDEIYFAEYASYHQPLINYKDTTAMECKEIHSITSNVQSFIGQCDNTQYQLRRTTDDTRLYGTGDVQSNQLKRRKQMLINMRVDQCCDNDEAAEYVAMYGIFSMLRGMDIKRAIKIPHLVNGIYNDMADLVYMRPVPAFDADSSFDAKDESESLTDENCEDSNHYISGLCSRKVSKEPSRADELRQDINHVSKASRSKSRSRRQTCSSVQSDKSQTSTGYSHPLPSGQRHPGTAGRESSPVSSKVTPFIYQVPLTQQDNRHFTSFAVTNQSLERTGGSSGDRVADYICTVLEPVVINEESVENRSSIWEISDDPIELLPSSKE